MSQNKKILSFFLSLVVLPLLLLFIFGYFRGKDYYNLSTNFGNQITTLLLFLAIIGCIITMFYNYTSGFKKSYWYTIPLAFGVGLSFIFLMGNSVSNFGF